MTNSVFSFFFTVSLLLLLAAALATASAGNATSGLRYDGCAPGDTVGGCIMAAVEGDEEGVEAVMGRILKPTVISYDGLLGAAAYKCNIAANCLKQVNGKDATCTYYNLCKRSV
ncbi:Protein RALF-like 27 [Raphanus sativus]|uniref:Protein RALF-like 27 n=1 Tax=Raphanus sativus TaxID=3726 RepID=A0A9W3CN37_RAPSA|nr:protein RALF-like 27 [Raphanus sativus]KAJ4871982.1 Protein RALF-like 27 [Raphanus sativus]